MLPGFRFLFATVVLAVSVLVFGLGAAALLRAAHEEFVNLPSWRLAQQPVLAPQFEMSGPTLAMLRIEALSAKPTLDKPRPQAIIRDIPRDLPETRPIEIVVPNALPDTSDAINGTEQVSPSSAPQDAQVAALNAQASVRDPAPAERTKAEDAKIEETKTAAIPDTTTSDAKPAETAASTPASPDSETKSFEAKSFETNPPATEASEPVPSQIVAAVDRSSEATASATLPKPMVKKIRRTNVQAIRQRRAAAIARARAAARARAVQQQGQASDPFGLLGTAPRS